MQKVDSIIFIIVAILMLIGAIFSYSLPVFLETKKHLGEFHFLFRYILFATIGFIIMITLSRLDPDKWFNKIGFSIFIISAILVITLPFLPESIAPIINGAKRWIKIGIFKFSPIEFFKIGVVFFLAWSFTRKVKKTKNLKEDISLLLPYIFILGIFGGIISLLLSDLGQVGVIMLTFAILLLAAGGRIKTLLFVGIIIAFGVFLAIISKEYRLKRIENWLYTMSSNFFSEPLVKGSIANYGQVIESINAIHHGGVLGVGIGNGIFKLGFLSDVHTDFVLAGIAEESGLIGITIILSLFAILLYRIFRISNRSEKKEYQLFALGIGSIIGIQLILNGLGITSLIPLKGLTVPFLSYGGSSLLAFATAIGMVLMISKKAKLN
ncbi:cell division protein FtsW [Caminibacter mediatlanticus TB-2]|uniref:Probable peptidoglycan glycosyltransferase FtsW n=1 Tax=Caminibacter mediatlanticus TB-2 TaxID=391592 RepID=A0AAI9AGI6_9BACT|nr:putative peptidoglycan glycosyltransferase FtsW [Caminibacter mediatlanticus]EDM23218.1 Cell cycle protein [Caminibacter mediatlanticus TB-2]QCT93902.1 cell division protein FtsW [Caminibacter mediatlanticus TB-2]